MHSPVLKQMAHRVSHRLRARRGEHCHYHNTKGIPPCQTFIAHPAFERQHDASRELCCSLRNIWGQVRSKPQPVRAVKHMYHEQTLGQRMPDPKGFPVLWRGRCLTKRERIPFPGGLEESAPKRWNYIGRDRGSFSVPSNDGEHERDGRRHEFPRTRPRQDMP